MEISVDIISMDFSIPEMDFLFEGSFRLVSPFHQYLQRSTAVALK